MKRRDALKLLGLGAAMEVLPEFGRAKPAVMPKALVFDTFGTVVDWRGSIIEEGTALGKSKHFEIDWPSFADRWRAGYAPAMEKVRKGELPWTRLDDLHRMILNEMLMEFRMMPPLSEEEKDHLNRVWHRLKPWPDMSRSAGEKLSNGTGVSFRKIEPSAFTETVSGSVWSCMAPASVFGS